MPGGNRGIITDVALGLNHDNVPEIVKDMKMWIDNGYRVDATMDKLGEAHDICKNNDALSDVWCYALTKDAVDGEY